MQVFIIASLTANGYLADTSNVSAKSTTWTSPEDLKFFVKKTKSAGVIVMGSHTYRTIGHPLKDRLNLIYTRHPSQITNSQPLPTDHRPLPTNIPYTTSLPPDQLVNQLTSHYQSVAICGGSQIYSLFLAAGVVDTLFLTIEPILFGQGIPFINSPMTQKLELKTTIPLSAQTLLLEYRVIKPYKSPMV